MNVIEDFNNIEISNNNLNNDVLINNIENNNFNSKMKNAYKVRKQNIKIIVLKKRKRLKKLLKKLLKRI